MTEKEITKKMQERLENFCNKNNFTIVKNIEKGESRFTAIVRKNRKKFLYTFMTDSYSPDKETLKELYKSFGMEVYINNDGTIYSVRNGHAICGGKDYIALHKDKFRLVKRNEFGHTYKSYVFR